MPIKFANPPPQPKRHTVVGFAAESSDDPPPSSRRSQAEKLKRMMHLHRTLVDEVQKRNGDTIIRFSRRCEEKLAELGGWDKNGIDLNDRRNEEVSVVQEILLPDSKSHFPVTVVDHVLPRDMCENLNEVHEKLGFEKFPSLLETLVSNLKVEDEHTRNLKKYAYEQSKNTSCLVQINSQPFANYLWKAVGNLLPEKQNYVGQFTTGLYEKCGIIPVFRFMRYQPGQGFRPHRDPQRIYATYPLETNDEYRKGEEGIYQSFFTIALYLNDADEFEGGQLNFVKLKFDSESKEKRYESQAAIDPTVGRCVLFDHDELHEGGGVETGTKYMCQCDVLYKRVGDLAISPVNLPRN